MGYTLSPLRGWNHRDILRQKRAEYGKQICATLSNQLVAEFGRSFAEKNLRRMVQFTEIYPDQGIVVTLSRQLSWSHFVELIHGKRPIIQADAVRLRYDRDNRGLSRGAAAACSLGRQPQELAESLPSQPRRGGSKPRPCCRRSAALIPRVLPYPTADAVGYMLSPLRGWPHHGNTVRSARARLESPSEEKTP